MNSEKTRVLPLIVAALLVPNLGPAQGTFEYDQQSADEISGGGGVFSIAASQPVGQSFTPALTSIGFVRLAVAGSAGTVMYVNLRTSSITGPVLGVSETILFTSSATGHSNFFFATPVALTPGATYFLQPTLQSGSGFIVAYNYDYPGGTAYFNGSPDVYFRDLWFREGIIVPEPSLGLLWATTAGVLVWRNWRGAGRQRIWRK